MSALKVTNTNGKKARIRIEKDTQHTDRVFMAINNICVSLPTTHARILADMLHDKCDQVEAQL